MKTQTGALNIPQSHLHSRISYLYQAATYLAEAYKKDSAKQKDDSKSSAAEDAKINENNDSSGRKQVDTETEETVNMKMDEDDRSQPTKTEKPSISEGLEPSRRLLSHLRVVSLKSQIRLTPTVKHSICKNCDSLLIPGRTSTSRFENRSRGGRKAWADVLVVTCISCGLAKRYPIGAKRQSRRTERVCKINPGYDGTDAAA